MLMSKPGSVQVLLKIQSYLLLGATLLEISQSLLTK